VGTRGELYQSVYRRMEGGGGGYERGATSVSIQGGGAPEGGGIS